MTASKRTVLTALTLLFAGFAAAVAVAVLHGGAWLVPLAYGSGAAGAWFTYAAAVRYGMAKQRAVIEANREQILARFQQVAAQQRKESGK